MHIVPNLWFDRNAEEAVTFYTSVFPEARTVSTSHYPTEGLPDFQAEFAGAVLTIEFQLAGQPFTALNAGSEFSFTPSTSFMVNFDPSRDARASVHLDELWAALAEGGQVLMPLDAHPFSQRYGWVQDRFGLSWQLILTHPDGDPRPVIIPSLLFGHTAQNRAREALEMYASVFPNSRLGQLVQYAEATGPAATGSLMFGEAQLLGLWFAAMDSAVDQSFTFTEAVSFAVYCDNQQEIDSLWMQLSRVPEAEACGWCKDQFGVSWQITPANIDELMTRPGAWQTLLGMKKLVIDHF
jgi:predicted 3-demethylubiquinone-9 3-methyltransferase (glyoxalase superfamily)